MPIIIDANRANDFTAPVAGHAPSILELTRTKKTKIVVGGRLLQEIMRTKLSALILEWGRSGRLIREDDTIVNDEENKIRAMAIQSDDPHVIALAIVSQCNLIYTDDFALMRDLKSAAISGRRRKIVTSRTKHKVGRRILEGFGCP